MLIWLEGMGGIGSEGVWKLDVVVTYHDAETSQDEWVPLAISITRPRYGDSEDRCRDVDGYG
jgi:hypothetical protein